MVLRDIPKLMDEPTSGLDPLMQNRFVELLREEKHGRWTPSWRPMTLQARR